MWYITSIFLVSTTFLAVTSTHLNLPKQWTYSYDAESYVHNSETIKHRAQWGLSGQVIAQNFKNYAIFKFHDLKISTYNGKIKKVPKVAIPGEARILMEPFIYNYHKAEIQVNADEPKWSINMKRSLASILHFDMDAIKSEIVVPEETMYGRCNVTYKLVDESNNKLRVDKVVDVAQCGGEIESHFIGNKVFAGCSGLNHQQVSRNTTRTYYIDDKDKPHIRNRIESTADIMFHVTPLDDHQQMIHQHQELTIQYFGDIKDKLDISKATVVKGIKYEHGSDSMEEMIDKRNWTDIELTYKMIDKLIYLCQEIERREVDSSWKLSKHMNDVWYMMSNQTFLSLKNAMNSIKSDYNIKRIFISFLPYIGSNESLKFIRMLIHSDQLDTQQLMKTLAVFPKYARHHSEELLKKMQFLMKLKQGSMMVKNSGILSFATLVRETYDKEKIDKELFNEYMHKYLKLFKESKYYEKRMVYLVGLQNLEVDLDVLLPIIKDEKESTHIRALAIQIALPKLKSSKDKFEAVFLPMLKSETLSLELRAAALNVLIETNRDINDFQSVYKYLKNESKEDLNIIHLYHYLFSSLASYAVDTKCENSLKRLSSEYLPKLKEPSVTNDFWTTGNYRTGFTNNGPDYGVNMQLRKVVNPITKTIETIEYNFDQFALGLQKKVAVHLKLHGLLENLFTTKNFNSHFVTPPPKVAQFGQYLQQANLNKTHDNINVEIIISIDDKAVLAKHFDEKSLKEIDSVFEEVWTILFKKTTEIYYPVMDYFHIPSDMGTDLAFNLKEGWLTHTSFEDINILGKMANTDYQMETKNYVAISKSVDLYDPISMSRHGAMQVQYRNVIAGVTLSFTNEDGDTYLQYENDKLVFKSRSDLHLMTYADRKNLFNEYENASPFKKYSIYQNDKKRTMTTSELPLLGHTIGFATNNTDSNKNKLSYPSLITEAIRDTIGNYEVAPVPGLIFTYFSAHLHELYVPKWVSGTIIMELKPSFKEPTKTMIHIVPDYDILEDHAQALIGLSTSVSLVFKVKSIKENKLLRMANVSIGYRMEPGLTNQSSNLDVQVMYDRKYVKMCTNLTVNGMPQRADLYSMEAADPTKTSLVAKLSLSDKVIEKCENSFITLDIDGEFSVSDEQTALASKTQNSPFKECKEDSAGLKYTAPTPYCRLAAEEMNRYRKYVFTVNRTVDKDNLQKSSDFNFYFEETSFIVQLLAEVFGLPNPLEITLDIPISKSNGILRLISPRESLNRTFELRPPIRKYPYIHKDLLISSTYFVNFMNDGVLGFGPTSSCRITKDWVQTFSGKVVKYKPTTYQDNIALIESVRAREAVLFKHTRDKHLDLYVWTDYFAIDAKYVSKDKIRVHYSSLADDLRDDFMEYGEMLRSANGKTKIYYVAEDVLYIKGSFMNIYYNTEFINIEAYSLYNSKIYGLCHS